MTCAVRLIKDSLAINYSITFAMHIKGTENTINVIEYFVFIVKTRALTNTQRALPAMSSV